LFCPNSTIAFFLIDHSVPSCIGDSVLPCFATTAFTLLLDYSVHPSFMTIAFFLVALAFFLVLFSRLQVKTDSVFSCFGWFFVQIISIYTKLIYVLNWAQTELNPSLSCLRLCAKIKIIMYWSTHKKIKSSIILCHYEILWKFNMDVESVFQLGVYTAFSNLDHHSYQVKRKTWLKFNSDLTYS